jgi:hypothetical protein
MSSVSDEEKRFMTLATGACTIKRYGSVIYGLHSKLGVFVPKPVKQSDNNEDTSLLCNQSSFRTLQISNVL